MLSIPMSSRRSPRKSASRSMPIFPDLAPVSDEMVTGMKRGATFHLDYWEAWSPTVKAAWQQFCIDGHLQLRQRRPRQQHESSAPANQPPLRQT